MVVFICAPLRDGLIPAYSVRGKIERQVAKDFLESLMQMSHDVAIGNVKTIPMDDVFERLEDLVGDVEVDINTKLPEE